MITPLRRLHELHKDSQKNNETPTVIAALNLSTAFSVYVLNFKTKELSGRWSQLADDNELDRSLFGPLIRNDFAE